MWSGVIEFHMKSTQSRWPSYAFVHRFNIIASQTTESIDSKCDGVSTLLTDWPFRLLIFCQGFIGYASRLVRVRGTFEPRPMPTDYLKSVRQLVAATHTIYAHDFCVANVVRWFACPEWITLTTSNGRISSQVSTLFRNDISATIADTTIHHNRTNERIECGQNAR